MDPLEDALGFSGSVFNNCGSGCGAYSYTDSGVIYVGCPIGPTISQQSVSVSSSPTPPPEHLDDEVEQDIESPDEVCVCVCVLITN